MKEEGMEPNKEEKEETESIKKIEAEPRKLEEPKKEDEPRKEAGPEKEAEPVSEELKETNLDEDDEYNLSDIEAELDQQGVDKNMVEGVDVELDSSSDSRPVAVTDEQESGKPSEQVTPPSPEDEVPRGIVSRRISEIAEVDADKVDGEPHSQEGPSVVDRTSSMTNTVCSGNGVVENTEISNHDIGGGASSPSLPVPSGDSEGSHPTLPPPSSGDAGRDHTDIDEEVSLSKPSPPGDECDSVPKHTDNPGGGGDVNCSSNLAQV